MEINKKLTKVNYKKANNRKIEYIVIHYVGATGGAEDNCKYFEKLYRGVSAHYFVGHSGEIWQCVEDKNIAWHCGAIKYKHKYCRNSNSIGVEMCCYKGVNGWYFEPKTVAATIDLVNKLMKEHNIPKERVIRHFDVTGKHCPEPYVRNPEDWNLFKSQLTTPKSEKEKNNVDKSVEIVVKEVIAGKWGNGEERKKRLKKAGYDYKTIQSLVNKALKK